MQSGMNYGRAADTTSLLKAVHAYAPVRPGYDIIDPPIPYFKTEGGMKHGWIRTMLCPVDKRNVLNNDRCYPYF